MLHLWVVVRRMIHCWKNKFLNYKWVFLLQRENHLKIKKKILISSVINTINLINLYLLPCDLTELDLEVINRWCPYGQQPWKIGKINQNIYQVDMLFLWKERLTSSQNYTKLDINFDEFSTLFVKILRPFIYTYRTL